jgi:hypothetical protein
MSAKAAACLFVCLGLSGLLACSKEPRQDVRVALALMPKDVDVLYGFSLDAARARGLTPNDLAAMLPDSQRAFALQVLDEARSLCPGKTLALGNVVGAQARGERSHFVALTGNFGSSQLRDCLKAARPPIDIEEENVAGLKIPVYLRGSTRVPAHWHDDHTLTLSIPSDKALLARFASAKSHALDDPDLRGLSEAINPNAVVWAIGRIPSPKDSRFVLPSVPQYFIANVTPGQTWNVDVALVYLAEDDAKKAQTMIGQVLQPALDRFKVPIKASQISVRVEGRHLRLGIEVQPDQARALTALGVKATPSAKNAP